VQRLCLDWKAIFYAWGFPRMGSLYRNWIVILLYAPFLAYCLVRIPVLVDSVFCLERSSKSAIYSNMLHFWTGLKCEMLATFGNINVCAVEIICGVCGICRTTAGTRQYTRH
jgi:hypothetical protein